MIPIEQKKEGKLIIDLINNLMPWEKTDFKSWFLDEMCNNNELDEICEQLGYVDPDNVDYVKEVIDQNMETDVLDEMYENDICDYLLESINFDDDLSYMIEKANISDVVKAFNNLNESKRKEFINEIIIEMFNEYIKNK